MPKVELLYFPGCPNVDAAKEQLRKAFVVLELPAKWIEIDVSAPDAPAHARGYGSPTVLVDGADVSEGKANAGATCRLYLDSESRGAPSVDAIVKAVRLSNPASPKLRRILPAVAVIPSVFLSALPILACPTCWPAYAGILSALGVPFLMKSSWLLPLTVVALVIALVSIGFRANLRRGFSPLVLGVLAASLVLVGKFWMETHWLTYSGTGFLVAAALWNGWPKRTNACETCAK